MRTRKQAMRRRILSGSPSSRNWSVRAKIISLLLVPLIALVVMWALATAVTVGPGLDLLKAQRNQENVARPAGSLVTELQDERQLTLVYLATGRKDSTELIGQRASTDAAAQTFRQLAGTEDSLAAATDLTTGRLYELFLQLDGIGRLRGGVDRGEVDRGGAQRQYTDITDSIFAVLGSIDGVADADLARESRALVGLARAREALAQEDAIVSGAAAAGSISVAELGQTIQLIGAQRSLFAVVRPDLTRSDQLAFEAMTATEPFTRLTALENKVVTDGRAGVAVPVDAATWRATYDPVVTALKDFEFQAADGLVDRGEPRAMVIFGQIAVAGLLGLITVIVTIVASLKIGRSLINRLAGLRQAAQELAIDRLPRVVSRLRQGEEVDVANEAPPLPYGDDEIGQVGHAFNELQRTAVNSAVEEANLRRGLNEVFLNIARRSQTLLHRQLSILDRMERRVDDPVELEDLFRVDHLATRMRRHAEDLVILAGSAPGRGWRNPVAIVDILRGAVSEVEDYARVSIRPMPELALAGRAVGDVIHVLAELIENATSFSPPHTRVNVGGEMVTHGFAVEIEDRGLGMSPEALVECNHRLAHPPNFDPANSAQLGLFVVARLAARHGVKVGLRTSAYGGITAVVLLPDDLVVGQAGELTALTDVPHPREAIAALPAAPHGGSAGPDQPNGGADTSGAVRGTLYRTEPPNYHTEPSNPRHARQEVIEAPVSAGADGLPRRVRQTSIAPQLREAAPEENGDNPTQGSASRSPEQSRAMMTSFQAGMARGRREAGPDDDADGGPSERNNR